MTSIPQPTDRVFYLIENQNQEWWYRHPMTSTSFDGKTTRIMGYEDRFTNDAIEATQFQTREAAETAIVSYSIENVNVTEHAWAAPIVPSPDSVKDMGEVTKHTPGPWKMATPNRLDKCIVINGVAEVYSDDIDFSEAVANAKLIAAAPATAARLEEVTRELQDERRTKEGLIDANAKTLERLGEVLQRYREALTKIQELVKYQESYAQVNIKDITDTALSRGATEQSTEQ